ncbi:unnamed protein product [Sympodiomycopsis kandeliae]
MTNLCQGNPKSTRVSQSVSMVIDSSDNEATEAPRQSNRKFPAVVDSSDDEVMKAPTPIKQKFPAIVDSSRNSTGPSASGSAAKFSSSANANEVGEEDPTKVSEQNDEKHSGKKDDQRLPRWALSGDDPGNEFWDLTIPEPYALSNDDICALMPESRMESKTRFPHKHHPQYLNVEQYLNAYMEQQAKLRGWNFEETKEALAMLPKVYERLSPVMTAFVKAMQGDLAPLRDDSWWLPFESDSINEWARLGAVILQGAWGSYFAIEIRNGRVVLLYNGRCKNHVRRVVAQHIPAANLDYGSASDRV